jgi:hypothetical protein
MLTITAWNVRDGSTKEYGPFEWVQVTYDTLRVPDESGVENPDEFAVYEPECQKDNPTIVSTSSDGWVFHDGFIASDFTLA